MELVGPAGPRPVWDGGTTTFEAFYDETVQRTFRLSMLLTRDREAATDLTYRAYLRLAGRRATATDRRDEVDLLAEVTELAREAGSSV